MKEMAMCTLESKPGTHVNLLLKSSMLQRQGFWTAVSKLGFQSMCEWVNFLLLVFKMKIWDWKMFAGLFWFDKAQL